ncbi:MAG: hypothetical protein D6729_16560 [Deltaproteobacteria bacterium]|nr:MAG: hypothetical protein D6729_16560 [Deltaproteobacteria bacterium]
MEVDPSNRATGARADAAFVAVAAAGGIVEVVFTDFRHGSWDVFRARSEDGGTTFAPAERIDPPAAEVTHRATGRTVEAERLHAYPAVVLNEAAPVILWSDLADRRRDTHVAWQQGGVTRRLDGAPPGRDAWRPAAAGDGARWFAVWQDLREGSSAVWLAADGVEVGRVSDLGPGGSAFAPQVAAGAQGVVVAWEDYRSGQARIRLSGPVTIEGP